MKPGIPFRHSELSQQAIDYLRKSGRKSLKKYAVQESINITRGLQDSVPNPERFGGRKWLLIDFLNEWPRYFITAPILKALQPVSGTQELADSLSDKALVGSFMAGSASACFVPQGERCLPNYPRGPETRERDRKLCRHWPGLRQPYWCCAN